MRVPRITAPCRVHGTGTCRAQWAKQAGGASEIARSAIHGVTMRVSRTRAPEQVWAAAPTYPLTSQLSGHAASVARPIFSGEAGCVPGLGGANAGRKRLARNRNSRLRLRCDSCFIWRCALGCVGGFQSGKRNSRAGAPFRFRRSASLLRPLGALGFGPTGRARLQSPQAPSLGPEPAAASGG